ncbi:hypothetical protein TSAR_015096 [Trichomalopsis sarcophagae]|uniref:Uncharacterized protein n=1 Tax=Trichomalopsis sarcophagae TaxID=543379 RepID=A0A232FCV6_9HYME|nr:hypothetical protein TSAR_015096 [Trichomalopsis sarcophagae]
MFRATMSPLLEGFEYCPSLPHGEDTRANLETREKESKKQQQQWRRASGCKWDEEERSGTPQRDDTRSLANWALEVTLSFARELPPHPLARG